MEDPPPFTRAGAITSLRDEIGAGGRRAGRFHRVAVSAQVGVAVLFVAVSLRVLREYERATTTLVSATVSPVMARYLARLEEGLHDLQRGVVTEVQPFVTASVDGERPSDGRRRNPP